MYRCSIETLARIHTGEVSKFPARASFSVKPKRRGPSSRAASGSPRASAALWSVEEEKMLVEVAKRQHKLSLSEKGREGAKPESSERFLDHQPKSSRKYC